MNIKTVKIILITGASLLLLGAAAFAIMSSRLSALNDELTDVMRSPAIQGDYHLDQIYTLTTERDLVASRIPWAIGTAFIGGMMLASGAILYRMAPRNGHESAHDASMPPPQ
jgi:hypothetical protein